MIYFWQPGNSIKSVDDKTPEIEEGFAWRWKVSGWSGELAGAFFDGGEGSEGMILMPGLLRDDSLRRRGCRWRLRCGTRRLS